MKQGFVGFMGFRVRVSIRVRARVRVRAGLCSSSVNRYSYPSSLMSGSAAASSLRPIICESTSRCLAADQCSTREPAPLGA